MFTSLQIDEVISQAQTTRAVLGSQRALFGDVQGKVKNLSDKFPIIRGLLGRKQSMLCIFIFWCDLLFIFYSLFLQVQLEGGDQETPLFSLQSLQLVPCFLLSIGFQNKYTNELLNWYKKVINYDASLGNFDYVISWGTNSYMFQKFLWYFSCGAIPINCLSGPKILSKSNP